MGMISTIFTAGALIWMCQPSSWTRFDSGAIISGVLAPPVARLKRMPRAPCSCMRFNSPSDTASLTTTTARACGPNAATASRVTRLSVP
jgi:hypothetical protein